MRKVILTLVFIICPLFVMAVLPVKDSEYEIEMAEIGEPGTLVVKVWCYNKKPNIDEQTALMNAVKGVMFKGVSDAGRMKGRRALVKTGYDSNPEYFDSFFSNNEFMEYAHIGVNNYVAQDDLIKIKKNYKIGKIVVVHFNELRKRLENDKIIEGLDSGF